MTILGYNFVLCLKKCFEILSRKFPRKYSSGDLKVWPTLSESISNSFWIYTCRYINECNVYPCIWFTVSLRQMIRTLSSACKHVNSSHPWHTNEIPGDLSRETWHRVRRYDDAAFDLNSATEFGRINTGCIPVVQAIKAKWTRGKLHWSDMVLKPQILTTFVSLRWLWMTRSRGKTSAILYILLHFYLLFFYLTWRGLQAVAGHLTEEMRNVVGTIGICFVFERIWLNSSLNRDWIMSRGYICYSSSTS